MKTPTSAHILISGSVGELDWIIPVVKKMHDKGKIINISFLKKSARVSFNLNKTLKEITYLNFNINEKTILNDNQLGLWNFIDRSYRFCNKATYYKFRKFIDFFFSIICKLLFTNFYHILNMHPSSLFIEFPADKRLLSAIFRANHLRIIYFPHSPHMYSENLGLENTNNFIFNHNLSSQDKEIYLFGLEEDVSALKDDGWQPAEKSKILITGHPRYSAKWIEYFVDYVDAPKKKDELKIAVISRGKGNFISENEHNRLTNIIHSSIVSLFPDCEVLIKLHPREPLDQSNWKNFLGKNFRIVDDHVYKIFCEVDIVLTMFTTVAMDAAIFELPIIEVYDPNISPALQIEQDGKYRSLYDLLGMVETARDESELKIKLKNITGNKNYSPVKSKVFLDLIEKSNNWEKVLENELTLW